MPEEMSVLSALVAGIAIGVFSGVAIMAMLFAGRDLYAASEPEEAVAPPVPVPAPAPVTPYTWLRPTNWRCQHGAEVHQWCDDCYREGAGQ